MSPLLSVLFLAIATTALGLVIRDDPKNPVPVIGPWSYTGCANETPLGRTLNGPSTSGNMTAEVCVTFCTNQDYGLAGLEYGHECFCGNSLQHNSTYGQTGCNMPCSADASQVCGGANRLTVYTNGDFIEPAIQESSGNYIALGCFKEGKTERVLSSYSFEDSEMTPDQCVETCNGRGYAFAGVEYSTECYCASHPSNQTMEVDISQCDMKCGGNRKAFCGGADRLVIYTDLGENERNGQHVRRH